MKRPKFLAFLKKVRRVVECGWSEKTTYRTPEYAKLAKSGLKSYGQCYVTARALNLVFGWTILFNGRDGNNHYWNKLPNGTEVDLTSDQMGGDGFYPIQTFRGTGKERKFKSVSNPRLKRFLKVVEPLLRTLEIQVLSLGD